MQKLKKFFIIVAIIFILANGSAGGIISQFAVSVGSYLGLCVGSVFSKQIRQDMSDINYNPFNTSEQKVINSTSVSFYKGVPIYRTDGLNRSGSFCAILLAYGDGADDVLNLAPKTITIAHGKLPPMCLVVYSSALTLMPTLCAAKPTLQPPQSVGHSPFCF